jgi:hypothetical protein
MLRAEWSKHVISDLPKNEIQFIFLLLWAHNTSA